MGSNKAANTDRLLRKVAKWIEPNTTNRRKFCSGGFDDGIATVDPRVISKKARYAREDAVRILADAKPGSGPLSSWVEVGALGSSDRMTLEAIPMRTLQSYLFGSGWQMHGEYPAAASWYHRAKRRGFHNSLLSEDRHEALVIIALAERRHVTEVLASLRGASRTTLT